MTSAKRVTLVLVFLHCVAAHENLNEHFRYYEGLSYNTVALHNSHQRAKRALCSEDKMVRLDFHSHGRHFNLRMTKDVSTFSPDAVEEVDGVEMPLDTSHIYSGDIFGEEGSRVFGGVIDGRFGGFIKTHHGTFHVERAEIYFKDKEVPFHSIIYHEDNINYHKYEAEHHSVFERMKKHQNSAVKEPDQEVKWVLKGPVKRRKKRALEKVVCELYIQTDHLFFKRYGTKEAVKTQIAKYIRALNDIYRIVDFGGITNIGFVAKRIKINTTVNANDPSNPFRFANIGAEKFLELTSAQNYDDYCLAYVFTDRDFDNGVLGLAWVGSSAAGICAKNKVQPDGRRKSLNTGIITIQNYNTYIKDPVKFITFAHEVGHSFGSPHDVGPACTPGESKNSALKDMGNFIMYARATSGEKSNNNKFSSCSIRDMTAVLKSRKDVCFVEFGIPICGNRIVDEGEMCDCGYADECDDQCCFNANEPRTSRCKLQPGKLCSPSQGPCCTEECTFKDTTNMCRMESECAHTGSCNGATALCPPSQHKENLTACNSNSQVCMSGICYGSICQKYGLQACFSANSDNKNDTQKLCYVHCMEKLKPDTCSSSGSEKWTNHFNKENVALQPGSPCNDFMGYCDVFSKCRLVDADGPLSRLRKAIFNAELYENVVEWVMGHWWAVLLMGIAFILLMAGLIKFCSVHTPSSNPELPPPKPLPSIARKPLPAERQEQERLEQERQEQERQEQARQEQERQEQARQEQERQKRERKPGRQQERPQRERQQRERQQRERQQRERQQQERQQRERQQQERQQRERQQQERQQRERQQQERQQRDKQQQERQQRERRQRERQQRDRQQHREQGQRGQRRR